MKTGIVLEGGAMRGMFTAGLLDVFMESGISFDGAVGVSAGATFGCNLKSHQIGRTLRYNEKYCRDKRYASIESLIRTGDIFNAKFDYHDIPFVLDPFDIETFQKDPMEFWLAATDVDTGDPVYRKCIYGDKRDIEWLRATASLPALSNVVYCSGSCLRGKSPEKAAGTFAEKYKETEAVNLGLSDGGTSDSVPIRFFEDLGYERIVVVCTQPKGYRKHKNRMLPALRIYLKDYPELLETIASRHEMYNATMDYLDKCQAEKTDRILVIRPRQALKIRQVVHDPAEIRRVYDYGRAEGLRRREEVKRFLAGKDGGIIDRTEDGTL